MKKLLPLCAMVACALCTQAASVDAAQALRAAQQFLNMNSASRRAPALNADLRLAYEAKSAAGVPNYYVFNRGAGDGYVVVSGDDCTLPVWGYSTCGLFDENDIPDNMRWWLGQYERELQYLRTHPSARARQAQELTTAVLPLLQTQWNQLEPFNNNCPIYDRSWFSVYRCATGCVATATAQIMKYYNWPATGTGSHSYECYVNGASTATTLSADFAQSTYRWDRMINNYNGNYTTAQADAVAKLMSDVGIAVDMSYGTSSGTSSYKAYNALLTYFDYDKSMEFRMRDFYALDEWEQMLRDELDARRPVYYSGSSSEGGHAFVFDGYDTNGYFHVNWGWGGTSDDYFACTLLNPRDQGVGSFEGGYNSGQQAIIGIKPNEGGEPATVEFRGYMVNFTTSTTSVALGGAMQMSMNSITFLGDGDLSTCYWGVNIVTDDLQNSLGGGYIVDASGIEVGSTYSASSISYTIPQMLAEGVYRIYAIYYTGNQGYYFERPKDRGQYIKMEVRGNRAYFSEGDIEQPQPEEPVKGDVNDDGTADVSDVNILINIILGNDRAENYAGRAYITDDTDIDVSDVNALINIILSK
ncbi:MAG: C10 family peptidase [Muribaculaceae bacterium]|nr:C10 family peptidase [Muribaculaceae bacterium]